MLLQAAAAVIFTATAGSITPAGLYTAPANPSGVVRVIVHADEKRDTSRITFAGGGGVAGLPLGASHLTAGRDPFTWTVEGFRASTFLAELAALRARRLRVMMNLTGGSHGNYKTDGKFDLAVWQDSMDSYNTPEIRRAVAEAVADGTIIGSSVMDEPHQNDSQTQFPEKSWGPLGWVTKGKVDGMCGYVKAIFPTLKVGVAHSHREFEPDSVYRTCDFLITQYRIIKGPVAVWRAGALDFARRSGIKTIIGVNVLHGGTPRSCANPPCPMNPTEADTISRQMAGAAPGYQPAPELCGISIWQYDRTYWSKPNNQTAFLSIANALSRLPAPAAGCRRL